MIIETVASSRLVADLGWTLVESMWQITAIAAVLFILLRLIDPTAPRLRYGVSIMAMAAAFFFTVGTFIQISSVKDPDIASEAVRRDDANANIGGLASRSSATKAENTRPVLGSEASVASSGPINEIRSLFDKYIPDVLPFAVAFWLLGVAFFSLRLTGGLWQLSCYKRNGVFPVEIEWLERFGELSRNIGISRRVTLLSSTLINTPIAIGIFKPLILLPTSAFLQIAPDELETIIAHELIHIRRYDPLVNAAQSAVEALFFYHPAIWWMTRQIRREREFAADASVMEAFDSSHTVYAKALANLEEIRHMADQDVPRVATAANGGNLMQRIQRILKVKTEMRGANSAWTAGLAFVLTSVVLLGLFSFNSVDRVKAHERTGGRKIAIGFVSIPPVDRTANPPKDSEATARLLIEKLRSHKVPAVGFVQGGMISDGDKLFPVRANIVRMWRDAGFEIGIGGFKHIWFSSTSYDDYVANVVKNEAIVKKILDEKGQQIRYFSYPYLNNGGTLEDKTRFEKWLKDKNYQFIPYTFDNDEWLYSFAYDAARNDNDVNTMKMIRDEYVAYMQKMSDYYEQYSQDMFHRDIAQTMVLTPSRLVTDTADEVFGMFEARGYSFVPMDEALSDDAYKTPESLVVVNSGISWFKRWSAKQGKPLPEEPKVSDDVVRVWKAAERKK